MQMATWVIFVGSLLLAGAGWCWPRRKCITPRSPIQRTAAVRSAITAAAGSVAKVPTQSRTIIILNAKCDLNQQRRFWPPFSSGFSIALPVFPILHRLDLTRIDVFSYLSISKLSKSGIPTWLGERSVLLVTRCKVYLLYIEHQKLRFLKTFFFLLNWFLPLTVSPLFISFKIHILSKSFLSLLFQQYRWRHYALTHLWQDTEPHIRGKMDMEVRVQYSELNFSPNLDGGAWSSGCWCVAGQRVTDRIFYWCLAMFGTSQSSLLLLSSRGQGPQGDTATGVPHPFFPVAPSGSA